jgi:hypothetical protein
VEGGIEAGNESGEGERGRGRLREKRTMEERQYRIE